MIKHTRLPRLGEARQIEEYNVIIYMYITTINDFKLWNSLGFTEGATERQKGN